MSTESLRSITVWLLRDCPWGGLWDQYRSWSVGGMFMGNGRKRMRSRRRRGEEAHNEKKEISWTLDDEAAFNLSR